MVAQRYFGRTQFVGDAVQNAPAQAAAQAAHGFAFGDFVFHNRIGVLVFDVKRHAQLRQIVGQHMGRKARLLLVQVDSHDVKVDGGAGFHLQQNVQQAIAVFVTR